MLLLVSVEKQLGLVLRPAEFRSGQAARVRFDRSGTVARNVRLRVRNLLAR